MFNQKGKPHSLRFREWLKHNMLTVLCTKSDKKDQKMGFERRTVLGSMES